MMWRKLPFVLVSMSCLIAAGCDGARPTPAGPVAPAPIAAPPSPTAVSPGYWAGSATVVSVGGTHGACGWGTSVGETRSGVDWKITISGESVSLDEDMRNSPTDDVPFSGTLNGRQFSATYSNGPDYQKFVCQFRDATLSGTFNAEFTAFDAVETLAWGAPGAETTVQRHWTVVRP